MAGRKIITKLIDDGLSLANQAPAYPIILNRADPATEVLRGRAAQMLLPKADRMKPIGPQFFDTSQKAYEETLTRVPQEDFMHMLPQPVYGRDLPKNNRLVPILENFDDVARVYADKMRPFVNKNVGYFYHTAPMYKKTEDLLQSDLAANEFMDRFSKAYAGSSPRTATEQNLLNASLLNYRDLEGLDLGYPVLNRAGNNDVGYPMISGMHPDLTRRLLAEEPTFLNNPKPTSFTENVRGNLQGITADTHNIRGILVSYDELFPGKIPREWFKNEDAYRMYREGGLTPAILKGGIDDSLGSQTVGGVSRQSEYGPIAEITERSANILGVPPAMGQSLGWFGLGNMTNLKSAPKTLTELTGDRLNITSQYLGEDPDTVFKMFAQGQIPLMNQGGRVGDDADIEAALMTARTEKAGGGGLKAGVTQQLAEYLMKFMGEEEAVKTATMLSARETRAAAADQLIRQKLMEQEKFTGTGKKFESFFDDVTRGKSEKFIPSNLENYQGAITLNPDQEAFKRLRQGYSGNFDQHIKTSIPGFDEVQNAVGNAVVRTLPQGGTFLDIGSSEGALLKAIVEGSEGRIRAHGVDPNLGMYETFNAKAIPQGATMERSAFGAPQDYGKLAWDADDTGPATNFFNPQNPYDIAHEAMVYQFISNERKPQMEAMKAALRPGGLMISEEKFGNVKPLYNFNEAQKDAYKSQFYTPQQIETKRQEVLMGGGDAIEGMNDYQVSQDEMERIISDLYGNRAQFWDSGNFKGYAASDDKYLLDDFIGNLGDLSSKYETEFMPRKFSDGGAVNDAMRIARAEGGSMPYGALPDLPYDVPRALTPFSTPEMVRRAEALRGSDDTDALLASSYSDDAISDMAVAYNMNKYIQDVHGGRPQPEATLSSHTPTLREQLIAMVPERDKVNIDRAYGAAELTGLPQFGEAHNRFIRTGESPSFGDQAMMAVDMAPGVLLAGAKPIYQGLKAGYQAAKPALSKVGLPTAVGALGLTAGADEAEAGIFGEAATKLLGEEGLNLAKRMYDEGASMAEIEAATNWYAPRKTSYAYDKLGNETKVPSIGAWRTYIDPKNARFAERKISNMPTSLKNVLEWPEFEAVYPGLMHTLNVVPYAKTRGGYFDQGRMMIGVGDVNHDFYRPFGGDPYQNVLMHELEHAVQGRSAFSSGSSPEIAGHEYQIRAGDLGEYDLGNEIYNTPLKMGYYYANPGEAEARNAANRFANPELRSLPIEATEDVPTSVRLPDYGGQAELEDILRVKDWWNSPEGHGLMEGQPILNKDRP